MDQFPCYGCANDRILIRDCDICNKTGYLAGSNPMVRLIEKIIDNKMDSGNNSCREMDIRFSSDRDLTNSVVFPLSMHENFECDECKVDPIKGRRYHCESCGDFDLCESCYVKTGHPHKLQLANEDDPKKLQLDRQTQRSTLMKSCRMSINRESQL